MGNMCSVKTPYSNVIHVKPKSSIKKLMQQMNDAEEENIITDIKNKIQYNIITKETAKEKLHIFMSYFEGSNREFNKIKEYIITL
jgi:AAA+ superfamily predicted ATPase